MFTEKDLVQMGAKGIDAQQAEQQISDFRAGFPPTQLVAPATVGDGMLQLSEEQLNELITYYNENKESYNIVKFVPASGAASRMFKHLFEFRELSAEEQEEELKNHRGFNSAHHFFHHINDFAFFNELDSIMTEQGSSVETALRNKNYNAIIDSLLNEEGLGYANLPKGLLSFHHTSSKARVAMEEHLVEASVYTADINHHAHVHFTVSPEHHDKFISIFGDRREPIEKEYKVNLKVGYSQQKASTDTIAVDLDNEPFRNQDGSLLFRPGGHGALIYNLNDLENEIIFIKNIDNVVPDRLRNTTYLYKKALGGLLLKLQQQTFEFLDLLDDGDLDENTLHTIEHFTRKELCIDIPVAYNGFETMEKIDFLYNKLNRPMRICGMVKNEGEPGGGPFWVMDNMGGKSLQIVESSQIDFNNKKQEEIVKKSTHFNPVDLVCGVYDFKDEKFNLLEFVDPETGFISTKSKDGKNLKAMELPGLWNGAMADWITLFVETPIITFNPVKTVNDLLRPQHQPE